MKNTVFFSVMGSEFIEMGLRIFKQNPVLLSEFLDVWVSWVMMVDIIMKMITMK